MRLTFCGAAQTVTGSQHLLELNGSRLLLDCGLYQGPRKESYERNQSFPFKPKEIDAVILSHAHIDHSGNLPLLVKQGFKGPIYATPATAHLTDLMLRDAGHVQEAQAQNINFHRQKRGEPPVEPLYTEEDAALVKPLLHNRDYGQSFEAAPGAIARLLDSGHILGAASVALKLEEHHRKTSLWFSGDIGRPKLPIVRDPTMPEEVDYLMMECTYGDKPHRDPDLAYQEMRDIVLRTLNRGGKVIIPSFAVGRTQSLVYNFHQMYRDGDLPEVPIYVDSPLAVNASQIFREHPECYDAETLEAIRNGHPALDFHLLTYVQSLEESKELNERKDPMIIISASGMAETGRIVYHIRWAIENPKNTIMIVSWQSPYTLGRRLADREKRVKILGEVYYRRAEIATIGGLSAHAGQDFLTEYAQRGGVKAKQIFLVHGEPNSAAALRQKLEQNGLKHIQYPEQKEIADFRE